MKSSAANNCKAKAVFRPSKKNKVFLCVGFIDTIECAQSKNILHSEILSPQTLKILNVLILFVFGHVSLAPSQCNFLPYKVITR